jgi:polyhydroxyalkanoate synthesis regulator phasin
MGHKAGFDDSKFSKLYGSRKEYSNRFSEAVDRLVKERWLTEGDAKRLKQALLQVIG